MYYDNTLKKWTGTSNALTWNPVSNVLTGNFTGNVYGTSNLIQTTRSATTSTDYYVPFVRDLASNTAGQVVYTDGNLSRQLSYNPNSGVLKTLTGDVQILKITDQITPARTWDIGSASDTLYFNYPTSIVDIVQLKPTGSFQINGSASAFRAIDRTNTARYIAWYSNNDILTWEYYNGTTTSNFMTFTTSTSTLTVSVVKPTNINDTSGNNGTTGQYLTKGASGILWNTLPTIGNGTLTISAGTFMTGSGTFTANQSTNTSITIGTNATAVNTASTIVARDASGNFSAGTITASLNGTASTGTQVIQTLFNPLMVTNRVLYPAFWFNSLSGGSKALYGDNSINALLTIRFETGIAGTTDPVFYTPNITNLGTIITGTITDGSSSVGTSGQYLTSTGSALSWVTLPTIGNGTLTISAGTFMTGSGTFTANQSTNTSITIGTNATAVNTVSTIVARDASGNFACGTITGSLTGSATLIDTTAIATGVRYLTFVPLATTQTGGQVLGTEASIFYTTNTKQLALGTTAGNVAKTPLAILDSTLTNGQNNSIQIGQGNSVNNSWFLTARYNTTASDSIFSIVPYGTAVTDGFYINTSGTTSSFTLEARNSLELRDIINTTVYGQVYASTGALVTGYNNSQLTIQYITGPITGGKTFQVGDQSIGVELILGDILTAQWGMATAGFEYGLYTDYFSSLGGVWGSLYSLNRHGKNDYKTNPTTGILLDYPVQNVDSVPVIYSSGASQTLTDFVSIAVTSVAFNVWTVTVKVNGNNPFGRTITISRNYAFNFLLTTTGATTTHTQTPTASSQNATLNGSAFTGYTFTQTGTGTAYSYNTSASANWTIAQPVGQMTWVLTANDTGNDEDTYVFTVDMNKSQVLPAGATATANPAVYGGSFMTLSYTATTISNVRTSGSGTLSVTATPANTLLTTTRSGTASGSLVLNNAVDVSATRVENTLQTTGTQYLTMLPNSASDLTDGQIVGTHASLSYNVASSTLYALNMNTVYRAGVTATSGTAYVPNIFTADYTDYEIYVSLVSPVTTGATLSFDLITGTSTRLSSGWDTITSYVNGTAMVSLTPPSSLCYITSLPNSTHYFKYKCVMTNPRSVIGAKQFIAGLNVGYLTGTTETTYTSSGLNTSTVSQTGFALIISGGGSWTGDVVVRGMNN
jgi:hypothetical protein